MMSSLPLLADMILLGALLNLAPANRLLTVLGLRRWRLAVLFLPGVGPFVFLWLVAFTGRETAPAKTVRDTVG